MDKIFIALLVVFLAPAALLADMDITVLEVKGIALTRQEAIQNGLIEALKQARGIKIDSRKEYINRIQELSHSKNSNHERSVDIKKIGSTKVKELTKGIINEYRIIDETQNNDGDWEITLTVKMLQYETPGISPHSRRKIAVMPFRTTRSIFTIGSKNIPAQEISRQFTQKLVTELTQSRRFTVLDRDYICEYFREKNLLLSGDTPLEEQMRLGEVLGVDYMLVGTITKAGIERTAYQIKALGKTGYHDKATFLADYRIVVMPTRQVKWSDSVNLTMGNKELRQIAGNADLLAMEQVLLQRAAQQVSHKALANIYPIRIAAIQANGSLILNQGGVSVSDGELFDIFQAGEKVIDPYSGESLGAAETWIATAQVERVLAKQSYAKVIKGEQAQVKNGDICRRVSGTKSNGSSTAQKKEKKMAIPW